MSWAETGKINSNIATPLNKQIINSKFPEIVRMSTNKRNLTTPIEFVVPQKGIYRIVIVGGQYFYRYYGIKEYGLPKVNVGVSTLKLNKNSIVKLTTPIYKVSYPNNPKYGKLFCCTTLNITNNTVNTTIKVYDNTYEEIDRPTVDEYTERSDESDFINTDLNFSEMPYIKEIMMLDNEVRYIGNDTYNNIVQSLCGLGLCRNGTSVWTRGAILYPVEIL